MVVVVVAFFGQLCLYHFHIHLLSCAGCLVLLLLLLMRRRLGQGVVLGNRRLVNCIVLAVVVAAVVIVVDRNSLANEPCRQEP